MMVASAAWSLPLGADWDPRLLIYGTYFAGALLLGAVVIAIINRWRRREEQRLSPDAQLAQFQSLYEAGVLNREEFERLSGMLASKDRPVAQEKPPVRPASSASPSLGQSIQPAPGAGPPPGSPETGIRPG